MALADTARLAVQIDLEGNAAAGITKLNRQVSGLGKSVGRMGKGFGQVGAGLTRAGLLVGGAAIAGITAAAKAAIDFEDAFAGVRKTVDEAELTAAGLSFEKLARQFRDMATEIPVAAAELAAIGETAGALGIRAGDIEEFTKTVALLGATTDLTTGAAAEALGKVGTILDLTGQEFEDFADVLVNLGNKGASTESEIIEITKRFGAAGKQAGLSIPQILAFASAIASAGAEPEAAGSSLSRLFGNLITETANGSKKAKAFAKVAGKSFKDFSKIVRDDTAGAMLLFLDRLKELDKFEQQKALKAVGITNVRDRNAILLLAETYDKNLVPALKNAQDASGALSVEAQKRFDTLRSKLTLLKNNFIEAGITVGEGFLPALGRATDKLIAFLKVDANKAALKQLGKDIGEAIDGIDWDAVLRGAKEFVGVMKGALSFALLMLQAINALPGPIKAAGVGFLALNKLSGGLVGAGVGNIVGGAAQGVLSRAPGVGKLFAQPVFVTNWPPGFGMGAGKGGVPGVAKAAVGGAAGLAGGLAIAAIAPVAAFAITKALIDATGKGIPERDLEGRTATAVARGLRAEAVPAIRGIPGQIVAKLPRAHGGLSPDARQEAANATSLKAKVAELALQEQRQGERTVQTVAQTKAAIDASKERLAAAAAETARETQRGAMGIRDTTRSSVYANAAIVAGATRSSAAGIIAAIYAARPVINVTHVTRNNTIQNRYGPGTGSNGQNLPGQSGV